MQPQLPGVGGLGVVHLTAPRVRRIQGSETATQQNVISNALRQIRLQDDAPLNNAPRPSVRFSQQDRNPQGPAYSSSNQQEEPSRWESKRSNYYAPDESGGNASYHEYDDRRSNGHRDEYDAEIERQNTAYRQEVENEINELVTEGGLELKDGFDIGRSSVMELQGELDRLRRADSRADYVANYKTDIYTGAGSVQAVAKMLNNKSMEVLGKKIYDKVRDGFLDRHLYKAARKYASTSEADPLTMMWKSLINVGFEENLLPVVLNSVFGRLMPVPKAQENGAIPRPPEPEVGQPQQQQQGQPSEPNLPPPTADELRLRQMLARNNPM